MGNPYGLSPVAETGAGGRDEADMNTSGSSSAKSSSVADPSGVYHGGSGLGQGPPSAEGDGRRDGYGAYVFGRGVDDIMVPGAMDDDAESMFRPSSPGSVTRPLQPLLAMQSPISCGTASGVTSRSNSFASPRTPAAGIAAGGIGSGGNITLGLPNMGLRKGIPTESLQVSLFDLGCRAFVRNVTSRLSMIGLSRLSHECGRHHDAGSVDLLL